MYYTHNHKDQACTLSVIVAFILFGFSGVTLYSLLSHQPIFHLLQLLRPLLAV